MGARTGLEEQRSMAMVAIEREADRSKSKDWTGDGKTKRCKYVPYVRSGEPTPRHPNRDPLEIFRRIHQVSTHFLAWLTSQIATKPTNTMFRYAFLVCSLALSGISSVDAFVVPSVS